MSLFTIPMKLLTAVVLESKSSLVVQKLLELGLLDFIKVETLASELTEKLTSVRRGNTTTQLSDMRTRIEALYRQLDVPVPGYDRLDLQNLQALDWQAYQKFLDDIASDLQTMRERQKDMNHALLRFGELLQYCNEGKLQYLDIRVGRAERGDLETLEQRLASFAHLILDGGKEKDTVVLTLRRDGSQTSALLDKFGWVESVKVAQQRDALKRLTAELQVKKDTLTAEIDKIKVTIQERIGKERLHLDTMWCNVRMHELIGQIEENFSHTRNTTIFSGWVPSQHAALLEEGIRNASEGQCVIEWIDAKAMPRKEIPVAVQDIPALSPFQKIVNNYHIPEYGTINPTPFVAITYLAMFGLMFGDAGQGLVIALIGLLGLRYYRRKGEKAGEGKMITSNLSRLFVYLGCASIIAGILFGSYFGFPLFKPLWFDYHSAVMGNSGHSDALAHDVYWVLGLTIKFGIGVIGLGLVLNWINLIKKKAWFVLVFDKNGIIGGWMFAIGVWAATFFVQSGYKTFPQGVFLPIAIIIPAIALLAKVPVHHAIEQRNDAKSEKSLGSLIMDSIMEWVVDMLEIFSGFLANTLSFMRVAGLGIAHVSLMAAFAQMADLVENTVGKIAIMVLGNALVIALEGLSAGIQSLRLNYYEFFSKYYTGKGFAYNPVALHPHGGKAK
ncbi:MAG: V-type ATPase 116kDa subunit family protein [Sphaerochaetaceae bacterium]|jgi:V/A-type H+-transporting ATPase subunit I|nr:ATPase [Sphaerochaetaceae bacterium]NLO61585.1 ATPase [Spirochaetales bacterium]MDD2405951.1 V-type ATPase 116kDa subunit family protein [Sphaerochaetaceae bacterium]MDD3670238.1 V-type ATPase 116kDa subunit family protein [Sphaerochaetaceae bacterium]MDD4260041.1 V-type ATPase 116kDa subunit family protein [Sphaerochaetaceae bacterium]